MRYEKVCFIMISDLINICYENDIFMKNKFYYFFIYIYIYFKKRYNYSKDSQIVIYKFLELKKSISRASIHKNIDPASGYKLGIQNKNFID